MERADNMKTGFNEIDSINNPSYFFIDEHLTIQYNDVYNWIYADWIGYQSESSVMKGCEKILEGLIHYRVSKVVNDNTKVIGIWTPAADWVANNWFPRMKENGLHYFAWIYSPSIMSQVSTDETLRMTPLPQLIKTFSEKASSESWLEEIE